MQGHIRKRGNTWQYTVDAGRGSGGGRRQRVKGGFPTKTECQRAMRRALHDLDMGACGEPAKITVADYLRKWLKDYARLNVGETTFVRYQEIVELHLNPALGGHLLPKLKPLHIQSYYTQACDSGRRDGKGGLSPTTVRQHHAVLRKALQQAIKWQMLSFNPADGVDAPRKATKEVSVLDEGQALRLIEAAKGGPYHVPIMLAVTTGMRRGEILGLRWSDIDLDSRVLHVGQTLARVGNDLKFKDPKTVKSRRSISLPSLATDTLRAYKRRQAGERLALGPAYHNLDLVCCHANGGPLKPGSFSKIVPILVQKAGLPRIKLHDLRHSHASHLFRQGQHPKLISARLGHSATGITMDLYTHMMPGMDEDAARQLDDVYRGAAENG